MTTMTETFHCSSCGDLKPKGAESVNPHLRMEELPHDAKLERIVSGFDLAKRSVRKAPMNS